MVGFFELESRYTWAYSEKTFFPRHHIADGPRATFTCAAVRFALAWRARWACVRASFRNLTSYLFLSFIFLLRHMVSSGTECIFHLRWGLHLRRPRAADSPQPRRRCVPPAPPPYALELGDFDLAGSPAAGSGFFWSRGGGGVI